MHTFPHILLVYVYNVNCIVFLKQHYYLLSSELIRQYAHKFHPFKLNEEITIDQQIIIYDDLLVVYSYSWEILYSYSFLRKFCKHHLIFHFITHPIYHSASHSLDVTQYLCVFSVSMCHYLSLSMCVSNYVSSIYVSLNIYLCV